MSRVASLGIVLCLALGAGRSAAAQAPDGQALYRQQCRSCHGIRGVPPRTMISIYPGLKSFADSAFLATHSEEKIVGVLENGSGKDMKPFKGKLTKEEMVAVAKYVRTLATPAAAAP